MYSQFYTLSISQWFAFDGSLGFPNPFTGGLHNCWVGFGSSFSGQISQSSVLDHMHLGTKSLCLDMLRVWNPEWAGSRHSLLDLSNVGTALFSRHSQYSTALIQPLGLIAGEYVSVAYIPYAMVSKMMFLYILHKSYKNVFFKYGFLRFVIINLDQV